MFVSVVQFTQFFYALCGSIKKLGLALLWDYHRGRKLNLGSLKINRKVLSKDS